MFSDLKIYTKPIISVMVTFSEFSSILSTMLNEQIYIEGENKCK